VDEIAADNYCVLWHIDRAFAYVESEKHPSDEGDEIQEPQIHKA
jgi:hypothetical protein